MTRKNASRVQASSPTPNDDASNVKEIESEESFTDEETASKFAQVIAQKKYGLLINGCLVLIVTFGKKKEIHQKFQS